LPHQHHTMDREPVRTVFAFGYESTISECCWIYRTIAMVEPNMHVIPKHASRVSLAHTVAAIYLGTTLKAFAGWGVGINPICREDIHSPSHG
jgi:hypothetical protein